MTNILFNNTTDQCKKLKQSIFAILAVSILFALAITTKSLIDFTRTGPEVQQEIINLYTAYASYAIARLSFWVFVISCVLSAIGVLVYSCIIKIVKGRFTFFGAILSAGLSLAAITTLQFLNHLLYLPGSISASFLYRSSRLYPIWEMLSPTLLHSLSIVLISFICLTVILATLSYIKSKSYKEASLIIFIFSLYVTGYYWTLPPSPATTATIIPSSITQPNIIMIGADTLRADRMGAESYYRNLTPNIDALAERGTQFTNTFVPLARTAPSITSIMTGTWPHTHGIRSNYNSDDKKNLPVSTLAHTLRQAGYSTAAVGDWAGGDLGKYDFGFDLIDVPEDQWNLKFLIRQGPKDIRLFLSLFTHNMFGKTFLPEIYYLAGVPLSNHVLLQGKDIITKLSSEEKPFFLTIFTGNTHLPFSSQYPYYNLYANKNYEGESKFVMAGLTSPEEIIKSQGAKKETFLDDIQQITDLYDGSVKSFDDEVGELISFLNNNGLTDNTIIVVFSDHGIDLFEKHTWGQGNSIIGNLPSARVPLIIYDPRRIGGHVEQRTTRSIDIAPTLLELANIPLPSSIEGVSLVPYIDHPADSSLTLDAFHETGVWLTQIPGTQSNHLKYPPIHKVLHTPDKNSGTLSVKPEFNDIIIQAKDRMLRTDDWMLVYLPLIDSSEEWLFDLRNDPEATQNVIQNHPEQANLLKSRLIDWMNSDKQRQWNGTHLVPLEKEKVRQ